MKLAFILIWLHNWCHWIDGTKSGAGAGHIVNGGSNEMAQHLETNMANFRVVREGRSLSRKSRRKLTEGAHGWLAKGRKKRGCCHNHFQSRATQHSNTKAASQKSRRLLESFLGLPRSSVNTNRIKLIIFDNELCEEHWRGFPKGGDGGKHIIIIIIMKTMILIWMWDGGKGAG